MASPETFTRAAAEYRASRPAVRQRQRADAAVDVAFDRDSELFAHLWYAIEAAHAALVAAELGDVAMTRACLDRLIGHVKCAARHWNKMRDAAASPFPADKAVGE